MRWLLRRRGIAVVPVLVAAGVLAVSVASVVGSPSDPVIPSDEVGALAGDTSGGLTTAAMTATADVIAIATGGSRRSEWIGRELVTRVDVGIDEALKGTPGASIDVVLPGGIDANRKIPVAMTYPGAPQIAPQEDVVLFLDSTTVGYTVVGFAQGKLTISENDDGERVVSDASGEKTLGELKAEIAAYLGGPYP